PPLDLHPSPTRRSSDLPLDGKDPLAVAYRTATTVQVTAAELAQWPPSLRNRFQRWRIHTAVAMPIRLGERAAGVVFAFRQRPGLDRKSTRLNSSHVKIS